MGEKLEELVPIFRANLRHKSPEQRLELALAMLREQRDVIDQILKIFEEEESSKRLEK